MSDKVRRVFFAALVVLGLVAVACAPEGQTGEATTEQGLSASTQCLPSSPACRPCPPHRICPMIACICDVPPGHQSNCTYIASCIQGYVWNDVSCSCVPATP